MDIGFWIMIVAWAFVLVWVPIIIFSNRKVHPRALFVLFFAEMWERFSYYGMRALLTLYMAKELFKALTEFEARSEALAIYGSYTSMVYLTPIIGGILADKVLGFRKAVIFGGLLMTAGHFALALEGMVFPGNMVLFFLSLAFIIVGNGFFKPNISSFLGNFYSLNDSRKDGAFTIFYMGVNIGSLLAIVTCGYVGEQISWHYGFGLAGIGMLLGLFVFWLAGPTVFGKKGINPTSMENFPEVNEEEDIKLLHGTKEDRIAALEKDAENFELINDSKTKRRQWLTYFLTIAAIPVVSLFLNLSDIVTWALIILSVGILGVLYVMSLKQESSKADATILDHPDAQNGKAAKERLWVVIVLFVFHAVFWALFEQAGGSVTLFTDTNVDRMVFGSEIPASIFQFFNAFFIMTLAPVFSFIWMKLRASKKEPSTPMKFVLGLSQLALGFVFLVVGSKVFADNGLVPVVFLALMYLFHSTGELSLSPVGLSMITKLSPKKTVGFVMGAWFLSIALANKMAGLIGGLTASEDVSESVGLEELLNVYSSTYLTWGVLVVGGAAVILFLTVPKLRKWMNGIH
ncbi:MAG: MFS transporter [Crocinitomicaceae bacterium]|nr:MFS transporter [Crocinitomicaceae bacterium]